MERIGLIGHPLGHSCSPRVHELLGFPGYDMWDIPPEKLEQFLLGASFDFANVTIPYKRDVMPFCALLGEEARNIGSVNTLIRQADGSLRGENTDAYGFLAMARRAGINLRNKKTLVLGSGGASKTVVAVIKKSGGEPIVISRNGENNYQNLSKHRDADLLVNATPVGMYPNADAQAVDLDALPHLEGVLDLIYNPLRTRLLLQAQDKGIPCANGLYMLCAQAARARELYSGQPVAPSALENAYLTLRRERCSLTLIGMPGCGKSTLGALLGKALKRTHLDTDTLVKQAAGKDCQRIICEDGEDAFRDLETKAVHSCCGTEGHVISCGGGVIKREENRRSLRMNSIVVWVKRDISKLALMGRPLSSSSSALTDMYEARKALYAQCADFSVENEGDIHSVAQKILEGFHEILGS